MTTYIFNKDMMKKQIDKLVSDDEMIILSNTLQGDMRGASKRLKGKIIGFGFSELIFKDKENISDLLDSVLFGMIIINKKHLSNQTNLEIKNYKGDKQ